MGTGVTREVTLSQPAWASGFGEASVEGLSEEEIEGE